jgi:hypothetical protein
MEACLVYEFIDHSMGYSIFTFDVTTCARLICFLALIGLAFPLWGNWFIFKSAELQTYIDTLQV